MQLTEHFTLEELYSSHTAVRLGINNAPSTDLYPNLLRLAGGLERVRNLVGPVIVSSGYRSPKLNAAVGGEKNSQHLSGLAADIVCPYFGKPRQVAQFLVSRAEEIKFDQLILEYPDSSTGGWVHISFDVAPRMDVLTRTRLQAGYMKGLAG